jgi:hypothetical protein
MCPRVHVHVCMCSCACAYKRALTCMCSTACARMRALPSMCSCPGGGWALVGGVGAGAVAPPASAQKLGGAGSPRPCVAVQQLWLRSRGRYVARPALTGPALTRLVWNPARVHLPGDGGAGRCAGARTAARGGAAYRLCARRSTARAAGKCSRRGTVLRDAPLLYGKQLGGWRCPGRHACCMHLVMQTAGCAAEGMFTVHEAVHVLEGQRGLAADMEACGGTSRAMRWRC